MIFLKHFDTSRQTLLGVGKVYVQRNTKVADLLPYIHEKMRWPVGTPLKLFEVWFEPSTRGDLFYFGICFADGCFPSSCTVFFSIFTLHFFGGYRKSNREWSSWWSLNQRSRRVKSRMVMLFASRLISMTKSKPGRSFYFFSHHVHHIGGCNSS